jgi:hypothetical protein
LEADAPDFQKIQEAAFTLGTNKFPYRMGQKMRWEFRWTGNEPGAELRITVASRCDPVAFEGPWALFKIFDVAGVKGRKVYWDFPCGLNYRAEYGLIGDFLARGHFKGLRLPERLCQ